MSARPRPSLVLFDFDGVLAHYTHAARLTELARVAGCTAARVDAALFASGLERAYDSGAIDTATYLQRLGAALGCTIDETAWIASRVAASRVDPAVLALVTSVAQRVPVGVLSNNGVLMAEAMRRIVAPLFPMLDGRVLCSGALRARKPERAIFDRALAHFAVEARQVLFLDNLFANVRGARAAGLQADTVHDARSLRRVLRRHGLGSAC
ncbi:HAD family hydrolase [Luteimonas sp. FCS-9]|uniref:HAD family hydrolase n=1 Tax=Luteimonas sp. FCS-9 TaxID=1547516 RepID=UPI00063EA515|nr:HAD family hydrolase [Luteimonas sp. FCS-9]KLJ00525.1 hydrolase [Luteimonas sp. FCS-9]